jgi:hypothetical protein
VLPGPAFKRTYLNVVLPQFTLITPASNNQSFFYLKKFKKKMAQKQFGILIVLALVPLLLKLLFIIRRQRSDKVS